jgi:hypothetical protein
MQALEFEHENICFPKICKISRFVNKYLLCQDHRFFQILWKNLMPNYMAPMILHSTFTRTPLGTINGNVRLTDPGWINREIPLIQGVKSSKWMIQQVIKGWLMYTGFVCRDDLVFIDKGKC